MLPDKEKRLTDPMPEWESAYLSLKTGMPYRSWIGRLFSIAENLLDEVLHPRRLKTTQELLTCIDVLLDVETLGKTAAVIGCGPRPESIVELTNNSYFVVGVEPVREAVKMAVDFVDGCAKIIHGTAERTDLATCSQSLILMEDVLEHVDSVNASLAEAFRILMPGGVLFVRTTNRQRFSITGINWEFTKRFFNWFPRLVKESYIFDQLHYRPELAHYSRRPAVHWFTFANLCECGRKAGFAQFYSPYDLFPLIRDNKSRRRHRRSRNKFLHNPWVRALIVSQMTGEIFMWKRAEY